MLTEKLQSISMRLQIICGKFENNAVDDFKQISRNSLIELFKDTLMQIWKSPYLFVIL